MSFSQLVVFDRRLAGAAIAGQAGRQIDEREVATRTEAAYRRGVDDGRAASDHQMVEFRADVQQLSDGVLQRLAEVESGLHEQLRAALPELALEIARRLLAGFEPPADLVARLCVEALEQLFPERENLELSLNPRDASLIESLDPEWRGRYPGLKVLADASLVPGDCLVRSRFGLTDARQSTKRAALEHSLRGN